MSNQNKPAGGSTPAPKPQDSKPSAPTPEEIAKAQAEAMAKAGFVVGKAPPKGGSKEGVGADVVEFITPNANAKRTQSNLIFKDAEGVERWMPVDQLTGHWVSAQTRRWTIHAPRWRFAYRIGEEAANALPVAKAPGKATNAIVEATEAAMAPATQG